MNTPAIDAAYINDLEERAEVIALFLPGGSGQGQVALRRIFEQDIPQLIATVRDQSALVPELEVLRARVTELEQQLHDATHCDCGEETPHGLCRYCDNDD